MTGDYRITVRGVMSERFCQGFPGLTRTVASGSTVLEGRDGAPPLPGVLATLGNLGLEVTGVERPPTRHQES